MAGFFPIFFKSYYSVGSDVTVSTAQLGIANSVSSFVVVLLAPLLGAIADAGSLKKRFLYLFAFLGILMSASLALVEQGNWELAAFIYALGNVGFMGSNIFYDGLLPSVSEDKNVDFISGLGFSLGYLGGGILFALNVFMVQEPDFFGFADKAEAIKASFISVAVWWAVFSLPLVLFVEEKKEHKKEKSSLILAGYLRLKKTFERVTSLKGLFLFLVAYWFYIDGVDTIIRMAVDYGMALGFDSSSLIMALLIVQFVGFPATLLVAKLADIWDTKKVIYLSIFVYIVIIIFASMMEKESEFYLLAVMISLVQGGIQALSRSYYSKMIPQKYSAEFFGFYDLLGKFAVILGPLLIAGVALLTNSSRLSIASVAVLFVIGGVLLLFVDEKKISKEVREALD
jgi:UMF1 family MFS transporter